MENRLSEQEITLTLKPKARDYLLDHGYDPSMGARPMRRLIQREIEEQLSLLILEGKSESKKAIVDFKDDRLLVKFARQKKPVLVSL
ncbi:MAG: hypothetical protein II684_08020 [Treponema sp.]|nr:hypothetical protein [Treponema sp.]